MVPRWRRGRTLSDGTVLHWWKQIVAVLAVYALYELVRSRAVSGAGEAFDNALLIIDWQKALGINHELAIQEWSLHWLPADRRQQLLLRVGLPRSPRSGSSCGSTAAAPTPTRCGATRWRS